MTRNLIEIVLPAAQAILTVLVAAWADRALGEGTTGKLAAAIGIAVLMVGVQLLLLVGPRRIGWLRRLLDERSRFEGTWIQRVNRVVQDGTGPNASRFALFRIVHVPALDGYTVEGSAYDAQGNRHSQWASAGIAQFSNDGKMTYQWEGVVVAKAEPGDPDRLGFCTLDLGQETGRVDHVALRLTLYFDLVRLTPELARKLGFSAVPSALAERDAFALGYAPSSG